MTFIDIFAGMGNVRQGFAQAGHTCLYSIEFDPHKRRIYNVIFGNEPEGADIRAVHAGDLPTADCWCFGFPCQDISVAGLQRGLDGERSGLFHEVMRLLSESEESHKPRYLFIENVKNLLSVHRGLDFLTVLTSLDENGYDAEWALLNSKSFGVPQNRERIYIIGHLRGQRTRQVFPLRYSDGISAPGGRDAREEGRCASAVTKDYAKAPNARGENYVRQIGNVMPTTTRDNPNQGRVYDPAGIAPCLNKMEGGGREPLIVQSCVALTNTEIKPIDTALTLRAGHHGMAGNGKNHPQNAVVVSIDRKATPGSTRRGAVKVERTGALDTQCNIAVAVMTPDRLEKAQNGRRFKEPGEPMFTLTKQGIHGVEVDDYIRKLTPRECMRLQGVDDAVTDRLIAAGISDTQLYRAAGDAVTIPVARAIAERMI